ncbi:hypothetical protein OEA41_006547 [Lepraria neglecta]|uniref:Rhodopsin domain-containing protein n=1 Tax=Lepraria neglecta TaxID=209136 RepID=A0AAE0DN54_9LECA|nr:hypothetical protein OEA41_006547 [Lepraria neglecta]
MSNFVDPVNYSSNLVTCNIVLLVVSVLIVGPRILSRTVLTGWRLGRDDYTMVLALVGTIIFTSFVIKTTYYGLGQHIWHVAMSTYTPDYLWWITATFAACPASYYFVKVSILFFYLRVFQLQAKLRYIIYVLFAYCTIYYWVAFFTIMGLCNRKNRMGCIEHYLALIAACMPLGPLFRWLCPSQWGKHAEHIELGPKTNHYDDAEAFQRVWPRNHNTRTTPDDSLMNGSITDPGEPMEKGFGV